MEASKMISIADDPLETLRRCGGYYSCPEGADGKRLGPLVGYAGKYEAGDRQMKQWVGGVYANFAMAEEFPDVLHRYAEQMGVKLAAVLDGIDVFCGAPIGGYSFADMLGFVYDRRVVKIEKKVTALATADKREESVVIFGRHQLRTGDRVGIVEDVCNNFSTTDQLVKLVERSVGKVTAITCLLNRSPAVDDMYTPAGSNTPLPVISLIRMPIQEYKQDDPEVADDIATGNVVWKPKDDWPRLMAAMEAAEKT